MKKLLTAHETFLLLMCWLQGLGEATSAAVVVPSVPKHKLRLRWLKAASTKLQEAEQEELPLQLQLKQKKVQVKQQQCLEQVIDHNSEIMALISSCFPSHHKRMLGQLG